MLALIFTRKLRPMIIGSLSGWLMFAGMMARPRATSLRTNSGVISLGMAAPKDSPGCCVNSSSSIFSPVLPVAFRLSMYASRSQVLAHRDELHLRRDDSFARVVHLRDVAALRARRGLRFRLKRSSASFGSASRSFP